MVEYANPSYNAAAAAKVTAPRPYYSGGVPVSSGSSSSSSSSSSSGGSGGGSTRTVTPDPTVGTVSPYTGHTIIENVNLDTGVVTNLTGSQATQVRTGSGTTTYVNVGPTQTTAAPTTQATSPFTPASFSTQQFANVGTRQYNAEVQPYSSPTGSLSQVQPSQSYASFQGNQYANVATGQTTQPIKDIDYSRISIKKASAGAPAGTLYETDLSRNQPQTSSLPGVTELPITVTHKEVSSPLYTQTSNVIGSTQATTAKFLGVEYQTNVPLIQAGGKGTWSQEFARVGDEALGRGQNAAAYARKPTVESGARTVGGYLVGGAGYAASFTTGFVSSLWGTGENTVNTFIQNPKEAPYVVVGSLIEGIGTAVTNIPTTLEYAQKTAQENPTKFAGETIAMIAIAKGTPAAYDVLSTQARNIYVRTGATEVAAADVFAPEVMAGERFPITSSSAQTIERVKATVTPEGKYVVAHASAGPLPPETTITMGPRAVAGLEDPGLYATSKGRASPYFLGTDQTAYDILVSEPSLSLNPLAPFKSRKPTITEVQVSGVSKVPYSVAKEPGFTSIKPYQESLASSDVAIVTKRSQIGTGELPRQKYTDPITGKRVKEGGTYEEEVVVPVGAKLEIVREGTPLQQLKGYSTYVKSGEFNVPIKQYKVVGTTNVVSLTETEAASVATKGYMGSSYKPSTTKVTPYVPISSAPKPQVVDISSKPSSYKPNYPTVSVSSYPKPAPSSSSGGLKPSSYSSITSTSSVTSYPSVSSPSSASSSASTSSTPSIGSPSSTPSSESGGSSGSGSGGISSPSGSSRPGSSGGSSFPPSSPSYPTYPKPKVPIIPVIGYKKKDNIKKGSFFVEVRRKGKFGKVGGFFESEREALGFGSKVVGSTAAATFKVLASTMGPTQRYTAQMKAQDYYTKAETKTGATLYIQKASKRISSAGEKREITYKGITASKQRKVFKAGRTLLS